MADGQVDEVADEPDEPIAAPSLGKRFLNLRTLVSFAFGFAILVFLANGVVGVDFSSVWGRVSTANPLFLVAALISFYATFLPRALRWRLLLQNVGYRRQRGVHLPGVPGLVEILLLSWFANCVVPAKLGDAYRGYLLKNGAGVSFSRTVGTILAERTIDVIVLFGLMVTAASLAFGRALPVQVVVLMQLGFVLVVVVVVGLLFLRNLRPLVLRVLPGRLHTKYRGFEEGTLQSFTNLPLVLLLTGLIWTGEVGRLTLVTYSLGLSNVAPSVLLFVALASALATTLPLTPAGLGFAEGTIVGIFLLAANAGLAPGVDETMAAGIAVLDRAISYWSVVVFGLIVYLFSRRK